MPTRSIWRTHSTERSKPANPAPNFRAGQTLTAHIAQFISTRDGRIASIETFDCYEPFSA